jgi:hypothetical protein
MCFSYLHHMLAIIVKLLVLLCKIYWSSKLGLLYQGESSVVQPDFRRKPARNALLGARGRACLHYLLNQLAGGLWLRRLCSFSATTTKDFIK